jgi:hypothetical protein
MYACCLDPGRPTYKENQVKMYKKYRFKYITSMKQKGSGSGSKWTCQIRIRIKVKSRIRIHIKMVWIHNTVCKAVAAFCEVGSEANDPGSGKHC